MRDNLVFLVIFVFAAALSGCAGLGGNIQERGSYYEKETERICDNFGCRNQSVERTREYESDEPASQRSQRYGNMPSWGHLSVSTRRGHMSVGYGNGGYPYYNAYPWPWHHRVAYPRAIVRPWY